MATGAAVVSAPRLTQPANRNFSDNGRRGRYGVAYLRALCATAGVTLTETSPDEDIDAVDVRLGFARASVPVQVKCTSGFQVGMRNATLPLEPGWVEKWTDQYGPVFVVLVKVPSGFHDWIACRPSMTTHKTVAFGKRFDPAAHSTSIQFTRTDHLTAETLYDWREEVYAHHERQIVGKP